VENTGVSIEDQDAVWDDGSDGPKERRTTSDLTGRRHFGEK